MTMLTGAGPSLSPGVGQRRLDLGTLANAELGGDFVNLPSAAGARVTSAPLYVAGFNGFMAVLSSTQGGSLLYYCNANPPRVTDVLLSGGGTLVVGMQVVTFGKRGGSTAWGDPFMLMTVIWANRIVVPGVLNSFRLYGLAKP